MNSVIQRFNDLVVSIYMYNEFQGFKQLEGFERDLKKYCPAESEFHSIVNKHAQDEKKHYKMFKGYFKSMGRMPFKVNLSIGYFDLLVRILTGTWTWDLNTKAVLTNPTKRAQMCRIIIVTEKRGLKQIDSLLSWPLIKNNPRLFEIFKVIKSDEVSHFFPYQTWLEQKNKRMPDFRESVLDVVVHYTIAIILFPIMFLNPRLERIREFY